MILKSFKYSMAEWSLDQLSLGSTNLIVGKNATGKTRTRYAISRVMRLLSNEKAIDLDENINTELLFDNAGCQMRLCIEIEDRQIKKEIFSIDGHELIHRTPQLTLFDGEVANPPEDLLLLHSRRDVDKYPEIETLLLWVRRILVRSFIETDTPNAETLCDIVDSFSEEMRRHVVEMANKVGFPLVNFDTFSNILRRTLPSDAKVPEGLDKLRFVVFIEKDVDEILPFEVMSEGMRRTLLILILLEHMAHSKFSSFLMVDDLGEGLDYTRATKVGRLLFDTCREHGIQLVAASNEEFMMNIVDIDCWNILVRHGQTVKSFTKDDAPELFEKFRFSGLDNFDFFTSDRLNRALEAHFGDNE